MTGKAYHKIKINIVLEVLVSVNRQENGPSLSKGKSKNDYLQMA